MSENFSQESGAQHESGHASEGGPGDNQGLVTIKIDGSPYSVRRGEHKVSELKTIGNVPVDYVLEQLINGVLTALPNDGKVHIRGGEVFSSHPGSGGAA